MQAVSTFDYATPYQLMVGVWDGLASAFDKNGDFDGTYASRVAIYWKKRGKILCFRQVQQTDRIHFRTDDKVAKSKKWVIGETPYHVDFLIVGKHGRGESDGKIYEGVETTPGTYLFHIKSKDGSFYNNQYFVNPNERRVIGPFVEAGQNEITYVLSQVFVRISYDVPANLRDPEDRSSV
jgi:hypothetical protein